VSLKVVKTQSVTEQLHACDSRRSAHKANIAIQEIHCTYEIRGPHFLPRVHIKVEIYFPDKAHAALNHSGTACLLIFSHPPPLPIYAAN